MSEPMYGKITMGGELKEALLPQFKEELGADIWNSFSEKDIEEEIEACREKDSVLEFYETEANYGTFENVENFCKQHGLTFTRYSEGSHETLPEIYSWDAKNKEERHTATDTYECPILDKEDVIRYMYAAQVLCKNPEQIPLVINKDDRSQWRLVETAKAIAKTGITDPFEVFKYCINERYKDPVDVPYFKIIP